MSGEPTFGPFIVQHGALSYHIKLHHNLYSFYQEIELTGRRREIIASPVSERGNCNKYSVGLKDKILIRSQTASGEHGLSSRAGGLT
jgi:hypothetical protein